jgi:WD40 repeat protein
MSKQSGQPTGRPLLYKGLEPYTEGDADLLFGRDEERDQLVYSLQSSRLTVLYGAKQVGKTSLLRAAVVNQLRQKSAQPSGGGCPEAAVVVFDNWSGPEIVNRLSSAINLELERIGVATTQSPDFKNSQFVERCQSWTSSLGKTGGEDGELFLLLDHFDDYLLKHPQCNTDPHSFDVEFPKVISKRGLGVNCLLAIRDDLLASLDRYHFTIPTLYDNLIRLEALNKKQARDAILSPVYVAYNRRNQDNKIGIEAELVDGVLTSCALNHSTKYQDSSDSGASPDQRFDACGLQLAMKAVWELEESRGSQTLRHQTFEKLGAVRGIADRYVKERFAALTQRERNLSARIFDHLVTPGGVGMTYQLSDLAKRVSATETELKAVIEILEHEKMVRASGFESRLAYEMAQRVLTRAVLDRVRSYDEEKIREEKRLASEIKTSSRLFSDNSQVDALRKIIKACDDWSNGVQRLLIDEQWKGDLRSTLREMLDNLAQKGQLGGHKGAVSSVAYSRDGNFIVTGTEAGRVVLWNIRSPGPMPTVYEQHKTWIWVLRASTDGKWVASGSDDGTVALWAVSGEGLAFNRSISFAEDSGASPSVRDLSFSPDGLLLAVATTDGMVRLWQLEEERILRNFKASGKAVRCVEFAPDGRCLATGGDDREIRLWDLKGNPFTGDGRRREGFHFEHAAAVWGIRFHPKGERLASCSEDHTIKIWNLKTMSEEPKLAGHTCPVLGIEFNSDGSLLASASDDGTAHLWDEKGNEIATFVHGGPVNGLCFSPDNLTLATAAADSKVRLWHVEGNRGPRSPKKFRHPNKAILLDVSFSSDGKSLATGGTDGEVQIWNEDGSVRRTLKGHSSWIISVVFHPLDPSSLATGCIDGTARMWNILEDTPRKFTPNDGKVLSVAISPDGRFLATGSEGGKICRWDLGELDDAPAVCFPSDRGSVWSIRFSPDGKWITAGCQDGSIQIRDLKGISVMQLKKVHEGQILSLGFSPDGRFLVSGSSEGRICVWDLSIQALKWFQDLGAPIWSVPFHPGGEFLASGSVDRTVCLWNLAGEKISEWSAAPVRGLAFSRDGQWLAGSCSDGTVRKWPVGNDDFESLLARATDEWEKIRPLLSPQTPASTSKGFVAKFAEVSEKATRRL